MSIAWLIAALLACVCVALAWLYRRETRDLAESELHGRELREQVNQLTVRAADTERALDAIANAATDPLLFVDRRNRILYSNPAAQHLSAECAPGHTLIEAFRAHEFDAWASQVSESPNTTDTQFFFQGRLYAVHAHIFADTMALALRDVSELQRLGRARRDFVANLSHELRTPLTAIRLLIDTLRSGAIQPDQRDQLLSQMVTQTDALTQIAQEMYDLSLIESGRMPMRLVETDVSALAQQVVERFAPQADNAHLALINAIAPNTRALIDTEQIKRVLSNLVHNAIKFTARGEIKLSASVQGDYLHIEVSDTGEGIPSDEQARIFERFYKVDRARGQRGTGLGLAIAKHIVEAHGGRIGVRSTLGKGSTFYFQVPM